jgi:hypothetical protein
MGLKLLLWSSGRRFSLLSPSILSAALLLSTGSSLCAQVSFVQHLAPPCGLRNAGIPDWDSHKSLCFVGHTRSNTLPLFKILLSTPDSPQNSLFSYITTPAVYLQCQVLPFNFQLCLRFLHRSLGFFIAPLPITAAAWQ